MLQYVFAGASFPRVVLSIGKRICSFMGVKWKNIPKKYAGINILEHSPYYSCSSFSHRRACGRPVRREVYVPSLSVLTNVDIIGKRKTSTPPSSITQISTNPYCVDGLYFGASNQSRQHGATSPRCIGAVMDFASVRVRIKTVFEF